MYICMFVKSAKYSNKLVNLWGLNQQWDTGDQGSFWIRAISFSGNLTKIWKQKWISEILTILTQFGGE